ncbi:MAG: 50S ribosomal protein L25 [uncultured bacterium]|nr:MAG: 50S ribosomal protein L25 [uncultured bacterium]OGT32812.1 MAG: 50S ribosomal protein L25/general stress protein Ctc [Gammaproteobacteria bacterium RIFCSPHIGHO2_02_FULL_39_13]OGT49932.1 MAG: 50S ribosomal protein L25/general stress protein Ctc [Gammaproteobacteria bacterium RIFCSPHIGHO2_12_FULL_39_24]
MSVSFEFEAQARQSTGKPAARRLRREDRVPAILYGAGKEPMPISLSHNKVIKALEHEAIYSHILTLNVEGASEKVVLKALMRHPTKPKIMHMDFLRINTKEKIHMRVPLHFLGEAKSPGLKDGGVLSKLITHLEITCLPLDLPEFIEVDVSGLTIGDSIHLSVISMPNNVVLTHAIADEEHDQVVVSIHAPREEEPEETAAPVAVETVITGQKAETEEEAAADGKDSKKPVADAKEAKKPEAKK